MLKWVLVTVASLLVVLLGLHAQWLAKGCTEHKLFMLKRTATECRKPSHPLRRLVDVFYKGGWADTGVACTCETTKNVL